MTDAAWMARALFVAERGRGGTGPNPMVGAVVVSPNGVVLGQGAHRVAGGPHAEPQALDQAGTAAAGATLYCTLEPCCHVGRTGPCVERIAAAGIRRVVTALEDPNPQVNGGGHAWLRAHGIQVQTGISEADARRQNQPFVTWMVERRPWTILKTATSVEDAVGRVGDRSKLSGPDADRWMHRQRAWVDAVMVGADTVISDDPLLTARGVFRQRPLTRVVVDWRARVPVDAQVWSTTEAGPVIMVVLASAVAETPAHVEQLAARGVRLDVHSSRDLRRVALRLGEAGVQSLLLEGGPRLQQAWLDAGLVDWLQWLKTPVRLAGTDGRPLVRMAPTVRTTLAVALEGETTLGLGADTLVEGPARCSRD